MTTRLTRVMWNSFNRRFLATEDDGDDLLTSHDDEDEKHDHGGHSEFGVHIVYEDLYDTIMFLTCIYIAGQVACRFLKMPDLVGEIVAGILLGPPLANFVPFAEAWVLLGEVGLVLLVVEAGIDIDVSTLSLIGTRGFLIAIVGSILPIALGILIAFLLSDEKDAKVAIAAGATFGPTSLGIALNILRSGGILNTPVGQLIVSAAVIDDMIALIILSQLEALTSDITVEAVLVPVVSALAFLTIGGYIALFILPGLLEKYLLYRVDHEQRGKLEMAIMFGILLFMMPATYYAKASYLMGGFVAGLAFCTSHELHVTFVTNFKRLMQWLMRIFFAASIGFQVPIKDFNDLKVIWRGLVFSLALLGKLGVGFLVPNFTQSRSFTGSHLRDCLITGFSMAAEGEFAFVIAVFAVDNGLVDKDLYASLVLAVLMSTIIPPFLLRYTISYYNAKAEETVRNIANAEMERHHLLEPDHHAKDEEEGGDEKMVEKTETERNEDLTAEILSHRAVFLVIQTQSDAKWGLLHNIMATVARLGLDMIDHRSWHPRGINTTLVNEIYVKDTIQIPQSKKGSSQIILDERIRTIQKALELVIAQPSVAKVKVQRWYPGVVEEIVESVHEKSDVHNTNSVNVEQRLLEEVSKSLDRREEVQLAATRARSVKEILSGMQQDQPSSAGALFVEQPHLDGDGTGGTDASLTASSPPGMQPSGLGKPPVARTKARRRRQKMRSTPVVGGGLFSETTPRAGRFEREEEEARHDSAAGDSKKTDAANQRFRNFLGSGGSGRARSGTKAEIIVDGESYDIRINESTLKALQTGFSGDWLDSRGVQLEQGPKLGISPAADSSPHAVVNRLHGYIRNPAMGMTQIVEEDVDSETSSMHGITKDTNSKTS